MSSSFIEGKDSLGESFVDPKDELISTTSHGTLQKEFATDPPDDKANQAMEVDRKLSNRNRKNTDMDGTISYPKLPR